MKANPIFMAMLISGIILSMVPNIAKARNDCEYQLKKHWDTPVEARFKNRYHNKEYFKGCQAAHSYVEGNLGSHSKEWNKGFTDCRFNVYRSAKTEHAAEKTTCGYLPCYR